MDLILFKIIKNLPTDNLLRQQWIDRCFELAIKKNHASLIESLILVLRKEALNKPDLMKAATELAKNSKQMQRALLNACGIKPLKDNKT